MKVRLINYWKYIGIWKETGDFSFYLIDFHAERDYEGLFINIVLLGFGLNIYKIRYET